MIAILLTVFDALAGHFDLVSQFLVTRDGSIARIVYRLPNLL